MSIHIEAKQGEIADKILLPGDPLRAKFIAENFLEDAVCFNTVRNMFGYTGTYKGHRVSVMGTGMGMPSISIYARELIVDYGVKTLIRVGTAGAINPDIHVRELVLAQAAATNSNIIRNDWPEFDFPQIADFKLLETADKVFAYVRQTDKERYLIVANLSDQNQSFEFPEAVKETIISNTEVQEVLSSNTLKPWDAFCIELF